MSNKNLRVEIYNKYNGKCAYCGSDINIRQMQVDHIIPKLNFINHVTNKFRILSFLRHLTIEAQVKRLNEYSASYRMAKRYGLINENEIKIKFYFERQ